MTEAQRLRDFVYYRVEPDSPTSHAMETIRNSYYTLAARLLAVLPDCRERSLALTALEESSMRAIQAVAVTYGEPQPILDQDEE